MNFNLTIEQIKAIFDAGKSEDKELMLEIIQENLNEGKSIFDPTYLNLDTIELFFGEDAV